MIEQDTVRLLRECDAGARMGMRSIEDVAPYVNGSPLGQALERSKNEHSHLESEIQTQLNRFGDRGKEPNPLAEGMSWLKTKVEMEVNGSERTVADLMTDGCNMGVKSLSRYLNQYAAADETSKNLAKRLIHEEQRLAEDLRAYL